MVTWSSTGISKQKVMTHISHHAPASCNHKNNSNEQLQLVDVELVKYQSAKTSSPLHPLVSEGAAAERMAEFFSSCSHLTLKEKRFHWEPHSVVQSKVRRYLYWLEMNGRRE